MKSSSVDLSTTTKSPDDTSDLGKVEPIQSFKDNKPTTNKNDSAIGERHKASANFYAGAFSGLVSTLCLQPLDVVKTRMQQGSQYIVSPSVTLQRVLSPRNPLSVAASIVANTGILSLWRGTSPTIIRNCLGVGIYFVSLNAITNLMQSDDPETHMPAWKTLLAGGLSRSLSAVLLCPLSVLKTRFEAQVIDQNRGIIKALVEIYKKERLRGLFSGLVPTIVRDAPYSASYFLIYLRVREGLSSIVNGTYFSHLSMTKTNISSSPSEYHMITMSVSFVAGLIGGFAATFLTQPQDVIKTRMQLRAYSINRSQQDASTIEVIHTIYREDGIVGFFRGASPRFLKRCLGSAITWMIYEEFVAIFDKLLNEKTQRQSSQHVRA
ncbi:mitochondrial carrier, iron import [Galdieria sulphuraria]|uniref:Mitochondrial carrier, iron import n=2 Tax=Galdieria sulphuraria TaxID=130081 RepID=M2X8W8_GALSU|nr:mitochondrial carrier, iron import [Galdieria sulphuraria]EME26267.1 mitochondrial carrier, iron import [Galdieria sulphuraria]|eukprot:XP_005702787.1 mitochondrial carrier, iron import [Galdieria sulphuraria]